MSKPKSTSEKLIIRSNNWRALGLHFALSVAGILAFIVVQPILSLVLRLANMVVEPLWLEYVYFLVPVIGGSFVYVACGYLFLKSTEEKSYLSVSWLALLTTFVGTMFGIVHTILGFPLFEGPGIFEIAGLLVVLFNTLGFGVIALFLTEGNLPDSALSLLLVLFASLFPSALLYLGLRLRIRRKGKQEFEKGEIA